MNKKFDENQVKAMLQLSILYDIQDSVQKVTDTPKANRTKQLAEWVKSEYPELHKKFGLDDVISFGKMKSPTWHPDVYRKLGMDSLPLNANGGFAYPAFHQESYDAIGLKGIKSGYPVGKISPIAFQGELLDRLGISDSPLTGSKNSSTLALRDRFRLALEEQSSGSAPIESQPEHSLSLREKFRLAREEQSSGSVPVEAQPARSLSIREKFQLPDLSSKP
jgi:hypothetical protein